MTYGIKRTGIFLVTVLFIIISQGCGSSYTLKDSGKVPATVFLETDSVLIQSETENLSEEGIKGIRENAIVENAGSGLLKDILKAYKPSTDPYSVAKSSASADFVIVLNRILVDQQKFTLNVPHPGPVYKVDMTVDIQHRGETVQRENFRCSANMSEVNFPDESFHWMSSEEKADPALQEETFRNALRSCYQELYFNLFDIRI